MFAISGFFLKKESVMLVNFDGDSWLQSAPWGTDVRAPGESSDFISSLLLWPNLRIRCSYTA